MNLPSLRKSNSMRISTPPILAQATKSKLFSNLSAILPKKSLNKLQAIRIAVISLSLLATIGATTKNANALDFNFSFADDPNDNAFGATHIAGTVTGVIQGLQDNQVNQQPTSLEILSFPAGLQGDLETSLMASDWVNTVGNGFTVDNGNIIAADWSAFQPDNGSGDGLDEIRINVLGNNALSFDRYSTVVFNADSFAGVTFSSASAAVPFDFSPSLGLVAMGSIFGLSRLRKHMTTCKSSNEISA